MGFTTDTKCTSVSLKPTDSLIVGKVNFNQDERKVTSELMGILHCHSPLTPEKTDVQPT